MCGQDGEQNGRKRPGLKVGTLKCYTLLHAHHRPGLVPPLGKPRLSPHGTLTGSPGCHKQCPGDGCWSAALQTLAQTQASSLPSAGRTHSLPSLNLSLNTGHSDKHPRPSSMAKSIYSEVKSKIKRSCISRCRHLSPPPSLCPMLPINKFPSPK